MGKWIGLKRRKGKYIYWKTCPVMEEASAMEEGGRFSQHDLYNQKSSHDTAICI